jgi:hypothetical protein
VTWTAPTSQPPCDTRKVLAGNTTSRAIALNTNAGVRQQAMAHGAMHAADKSSEMDDLVSRITSALTA